MSYPIEDQLVIMVASLALFQLDVVDRTRPPQCDLRRAGRRRTARAFDFDGVIADDSAEQVFQKEGIDAFYNSETEKADTAVAPGPLGDLFRKLGNLRTLEDEREEQDRNYRRFLKTAIVTARSAPAHRRVINTLRFLEHHR